ncbi:MAG: hypothetical protein AAB546_02850 [Patescibacteria group bacterium]
MKKQNRELSKLLMLLSFVAVVLSGIGFMGNDIWLASTQWLLVAAVIGIFANYLKD